jgi:hypothetical protein
VICETSVAACSEAFVSEVVVPDPEQATRSSDAVTRATPEKIFDFFIIPPISILNEFQDIESIHEDVIDCKRRTDKIIVFFEVRLLI